MLLELIGGASGASNGAGVTVCLKWSSAEWAECDGEYVSRVISGTVVGESKAMGSNLTLEFRQEVRGDIHPWCFVADTISGGTPLALGVPVAPISGIWLGVGRSETSGIEEPADPLRFVAAGGSTDILHEAGVCVQVVVISHGTNLLDREWPAPVAAGSVAGGVVIGGPPRFSCVVGVVGKIDVVEFVASRQ